MESASNSRRSRSYDEVSGGFSVFTLCNVVDGALTGDENAGRVSIGPGHFSDTIVRNIVLNKSKYHLLIRTVVNGIYISADAIVVRTCFFVYLRLVFGPLFATGFIFNSGFVKILV